MSERTKYPWADGYRIDQLLALLKYHRHILQPGQLGEAVDKITDELATLKAQRDELLAVVKIFRNSLFFERNTEQAKNACISTIAKIEGAKE